MLPDDSVVLTGTPYTRIDRNSWAEFYTSLQVLRDQSVTDTYVFVDASWDPILISTQDCIDNLSMIKEFFPNPKFIILKRSVLKCLSSMVKINKPNKIEEYVDNQMHLENGFIGRNLYSIKNAIKSKEKCIELTYDEICDNTDKFFKKLGNYLKINIKYNIKKIKKFNVNGICYNDKPLGVEMHKLKNKINKSNYEITQYLPKHIIEKYKKFDLWQNLKEF